MNVLARIRRQRSRKPTKEHEQKTLAFSFNSSKLENEIPDAYERALFDAVQGEQTLFASTDEVKYSWAFITPILEAWGNLPILQYKRGSAGSQVESV